MSKLEHFWTINIWSTLPINNAEKLAIPYIHVLSQSSTCHPENAQEQWSSSEFCQIECMNIFHRSTRKASSWFTSQLSSLTKRVTMALATAMFIKGYKTVWENVNLLSNWQLSHSWEICGKLVIEGIWYTHMCFMDSRCTESIDTWMYHWIFAFILQECAVFYFILSLIII